jgi:hypothetical protein
MIGLKNPNFVIDPNTRRLLNEAVRADVLGRPSPFMRGERKRLSERLATEATLALLAPIRSSHKVEDANEQRRQMPGYDLVIDQRLRIQVKGGTYVESVGWTQSDSPNAADLEYDVLVLVDLGSCSMGGMADLRSIGSRSKTLPISTLFRT